MNKYFFIQIMFVYLLDVDLAGVFEEAEKIEGMRITHTTKDSGFKTKSWPVIIVTFE